MIAMMMPGKQIRRLRMERHITQEQLAEAMNVSVPAVSKWETEQSAPELSLLVALADYFAVSVDSLLGHTVQRSRLDDLMQQMTDARHTRDHDRLRALIDETLTAYPNSYDAVDAAASGCYALYVQDNDKARLAQCIELTKRLFSLIENHSDARITGLYLSLANQYELMEDWEQALRYYELYNVNGASNMHIARCKLHLGCPEEALHVLSDDVIEKTSLLLSIACALSDIHEGAQRTEQARAALRWALTATEALGRENPYIANILCILNLRLFALEDAAECTEAACAALEAAFRHAKAADDKAADIKSFAFLSPAKAPDLMTNHPSCMQMLQALLAHEQHAKYRGLLENLE